MEPLIVTARLVSGYVATDAWSPSLDGILAYWQLREQLGDEAFALGATGFAETVPADLSGALETGSDGERTWWVCSSPIVTDEPVKHDRWYHRRFDQAQAAASLAERTKVVSIKGGAYKAYRNRETMIIPADGCLRWHAVGDAAAIRRLLRRCTHIGRGSARGNGEVREWSIEPGGDETIARLHRPLPLGYALARGLSGVVYRWGLQPPGRDPAHQTDCVMP